MNKRSLAALILITLTVAACSTNKKSSFKYYPDESWEQIENLKAAGWSTAKLETAHDFAEELNMAAMVLVHNGKIVQKWGDVHRKISTHSIRKSFLSALYGPAVRKGLIDLSATLEELGINDIPPRLTEEEQQATVRMLLMGRSGVYHNAAFATAAMHAAQPPRHSHAPGTYWYYNNWDFNVAGYVYRQQTGNDIFKAFYNIIAKPIGMKHFNPETDGRYVYEREMSKYPAYPIQIDAMDMARFGLLMARDGRWQDMQIIPEFWVKQSTVSYSNTDNGAYPDSSADAYAQGYGYMWWVAVGGEHFKGVDHMPYGLYTARGYRGHVLAIIPDYDLVFVYRNDDSNGNESTSYSDIGKLLRKLLDAKGIFKEAY